MRVYGRSLTQGTPCEVVISSKEMIEAMAEPITAILDSICTVIEKTPPELLGDILRDGITMTGGGSMLHGLDRLIEYVTGIPTHLARQPVNCVVLGAGQLLEHLDKMPEGMVSLPSRTRG